MSLNKIFFVKICFIFHIFLLFIRIYNRMRDFLRTYYQTSFSVKICEIKKHLPNNFNFIFKALNLNFKSKATYTSKIKVGQLKRRKILHLQTCNWIFGSDPQPNPPTIK
jgi:hypothetical protein